MEIGHLRKWRMFERYVWSHWQTVRMPWDLTQQPTDAAAFDKVIVNMTAQIEKEK